MCRGFMSCVLHRLAHLQPQHDILQWGGSVGAAPQCGHSAESSVVVSVLASRQAVKQLCGKVWVRRGSSWLMACFLLLRMLPCFCVQLSCWQLTSQPVTPWGVLCCVLSTALAELLKGSAVANTI